MEMHTTVHLLKTKETMVEQYMLETLTTVHSKRTTHFTMVEQSMMEMHTTVSSQITKVMIM